jgi:hypothetical protein
MKKLFIILFIVSIFLTNCIRKIQHLDDTVIKDGKYDSEFPGIPVSEEFEKILRSVKLINSISTYESYDFDSVAFLTKKNITDSLIQEKYVAKRYFTKPASGTATIIYYIDNRIGLLTCAHIVDFPDTIIHHFVDKEKNETEYIRNISFKIRSSINVLELPEIKDYKIIAMDRKQDIAIIGKEFSTQPIFPIPLLQIPAGSAEELNWGDIVYLLGYPRGTKMITNCLVSNPNRDRHHSFVINAVSARGISGGPIFAIRDGIPNFELVGIAKAIAAENHYYLVPHEEYDMSGYDILRAYQEEIFVSSQESVYYGILYAISIESIKEFIHKRRSILKKNKYAVNYFFK